MCLYKECIPKFSSFLKEEYPKGEVVGRKNLIYRFVIDLPPRSLGTPPPERRGAAVSAYIELR